MFSADLKKELKRMLLGLVIMSVIAYGVFAAFGYYDMKVVLGLLLGAATAFINFLLLGITVQKAVEKEPGGAKSAMGVSYTLRMVMIAASVIFAIKSPYINYCAAVVPLVFPRIIIMLYNLKKVKTDERA